MNRFFRRKNFGAVLFAAFVFFCVSCSANVLDLESAFGDNPTELKALNSYAKNNFISKKGFACYKFSELQKKQIQSAVQD